MEIESLVLAYRPELVNSLVEMLFSARCPMSLRYFCLESIHSAAEHLANSYVCYFCAFLAFNSVETLNISFRIFIFHIPFGIFDTTLIPFIFCQKINAI